MNSLKLVKVNEFLDGAVRLELQVFGRQWSAFRFPGYVGLVLATALAEILVIHRGLSPWAMLGIVALAVATSLGTVMVTKIATGLESIICYHHQLVVTGIVAAALALFRQPILAYLEATMLGVGLFIAAGRLGCLMVGCCHGLPSRFGVCYRPEHGEAGFAAYLVGVRLFPVQALASILLLANILTGSLLVLSGHLPGVSLAWYFSAYALGRFLLELLRGDPQRQYYWGFSEAQWTAIVTTLAIVALSGGGALPFQVWLAAPAISLFAVAALLILYRYGRSGGDAASELLQPYHIREVAEALEWLANRRSEAGLDGPGPPTQVAAASTSLGILITEGLIWSEAGPLVHYAISSRDEAMRETTARRLAELISDLKHVSGTGRLLAGEEAVFHLLLAPRPGEAALY